MASNSDGRGCLFETDSLMRRILTHIGEFAGTCILDFALYFKVKLKRTERVKCSANDTVRIVRLCIHLARTHVNTSCTHVSRAFFEQTKTKDSL